MTSYHCTPWEYAHVPSLRYPVYIQVQLGSNKYVLEHFPLGDILRSDWIKGIME